jgi:hypothetical protein
MTNGHFHLRRFVVPARMINHRLHSSRFIVRGKRGANSRLATVGPGRRAVSQHRHSFKDGSEPRNWQICRQPISELCGRLLSVNKVA